MKMKKLCLACRHPFSPRRSRQIFCGLACFHAHRQSDPAWKQAQRRGGLRAGKTKRVQMRQRWAVAGVPPDVASRLHDEGYRQGWKRGERVGFAAGYEQALKDTRQAGAA